MASSHFGSSTKRSSRVCKSFQLVKPNQYSSTSMFGGRGHQSHKGRRGAIRWLFVASQRTLCRGQVENLEPQRSRRTREVRKERVRQGLFSIEHYGLISIQQHTIFDVPAHGSRKDDLFQIAAFLQQVVRGIAM